LPSPDKFFQADDRIMSRTPRTVRNAMPPHANNEPLTDAELDHLGRFLTDCSGGKAMNIEELDGFFAALIAGPETVAPSE
jgi:hypothetical protein